MHITPPLAEVLDYRGPATHMAITVELLADRETPISIYEKLGGNREGTFLLESAEGGETFGRYSFIGCSTRATFSFAEGVATIRRGAGEEQVVTSDPLAEVEKMLGAYRVVARPALPRFQGGLVGFYAYDAVRYLERVPLPAAQPVAHPEVLFMLVDELVIFDHLKQRIILLTHVPLYGDRQQNYHGATARLSELQSMCEAPGKTEPIFAPPVALPSGAATSDAPTWRSNMSREHFLQIVQRAKEEIAAGEVFQVVLSQRLTVEESLPPFAIYRSLRAINPSPYMYYLHCGNFVVVGASPEVLVRLDGHEVLLRPIAGTRPRGRDAAEDEALAAQLLADEKELSEHRMLVDLGRNDVGRIAQVGTVRVENLLHIEKYSHVMHIVSDVRGQLSAGSSAFDALRACFPAGTVSGAPKIRAMEIISALEPERRGIYAGAVGYFDFGGNMDMCIAIRTLIVEKERIHLQAGAGVVFDSQPANEHQECLNKARGGLLAIAWAKQMQRGSA